MNEFIWSLITAVEAKVDALHYTDSVRYRWLYLYPKSPLRLLKRALVFVWARTR